MNIASLRDQDRGASRRLQISDVLHRRHCGFCEQPAERGEMNSPGSFPGSPTPGAGRIRWALPPNPRWTSNFSFLSRNLSRLYGGDPFCCRCDHSTRLGRYRAALRINSASRHS
jgi:hypothetical protein